MDLINILEFDEVEYEFFEEEDELRESYVFLVWVSGNRVLFWDVISNW